MKSDDGPKKQSKSKLQLLRTSGENSPLTERMQRVLLPASSVINNLNFLTKVSFVLLETLSENRLIRTNS